MVEQLEIISPLEASASIDLVSQQDSSHHSTPIKAPFFPTHCHTVAESLLLLVCNLLIPLILQ